MIAPPRRKCEDKRAIILLSAYGKSPYLVMQVQSIARQMQESDLLVIVDDGSKTVDWEDIHNHLPKNYYLWTRMQNIGSSRSFIELLLDPLWDGGNWYFLADQDDIWGDEKIACQTTQTSLSKISFHSTLEDWTALSSTAEKRQNTKTKVVQRQSPEHYFFETPAPGMTMCIGRQFREELKCISNVLREAASILPHDRVIAAYGGWTNAVECLDGTWVTYRQHHDNQIGAAASHRAGDGVLRRLKRLPAIVREIHASNQLLASFKETSPADARSSTIPLSHRIRANPLENAIIHVLRKLIG